MKRLLIPLLLLTLACGTLPATPEKRESTEANNGTLLTSPTETPQIHRNCYVVVADTLTLRKGAGEEFAAWDGMELHAGYAFRAEPVWVGSELWLRISPVEFVAAQIGERVFVAGC